MNRSEPKPNSAWMRLSDAQRVIWLDLRLGADARAYLVATRMRLVGHWNAEAAIEALDLLHAQHDALRLEVDAHEPRQRLRASAQARLNIHTDCKGQEAEVLAWQAQLLDQPLELGNGPLFTVDVLPCGPAHCEVLFRAHHLLLDHLGLLLAINAWIDLYRLLSRPDRAGMPTQSGGTSFTATLEDDQRYEASEQAQTDLAYWRTRFEHLPIPLLEPRSRGSLPNRPVESPQRLQLIGAAHGAWTAACQRAGVTPQRAMTAVLAVALGTHFDRRDLTLGIALHRRSRSTQQVLGNFAAAMPARCRWSPDATLHEVVQRVAAEQDMDYRHQRAPMDAVAREIGLSHRGLPRLFDASLSFMHFDGAVLGGVAERGVQVSLHEALPAAIVPLPFLVSEQTAEGRLDITFPWDPAFLSAEGAASLMQRLAHVMDRFCHGKRVPVSELSTVTQAGRQALLDMNPGPLEVPAQTLHARFAEQARAQPDAVAVLDGEQVLSYAQLAEQARTLAEQIRRALPTPQHPDLAAAPIVAVALPRSAATVVAFLATLQAGAVYLPLDCSYPTARLQMLLDDAHAALLIDAAPTLGLRCVRLPSAVVSALTSLHLPSAAGPCAPPPAPAVCPGDLAYLIYTSGSTGLPKPVAVSHAAALNLAFARRSHAPVGPGDRILAGVSVGFDVSIEQLLLPLLHGAAVVIAPALGQIDARAFWSLVQGYQVSDINSVPSFIDAVCDALPAAGVPSLKRLMLGGEPFTPALALKLRQRLPGVALWNIYGPTEVCIEATAWRVPDEGPLPAALPIGQPLANYRAYVLDSLGRLCPPGVAGELGLAGAGLARGYLGRPGETARRFVADPFGAPGTRLYRTGDRARWRLDGQLEFLGRDDEQVKIRGFRIETGEVQSALLMHPAVRQAAVVPWSLHGQATRLVAYVVMQPAAAGAPHSSPSDTLADAPLLRAWLAERLPHHMLPQDFIVLASLPITTNGKLDRRALPAPVELTTTASYAPPQGELEQTLASVWQTVLGVPRVGRHDSFFDLGGHSLLAIAMVEQLRHAGWSLDLASVFASPALDALAAACTPLLAEGDDTTGAPSPIPQGVDRLSPQMLPAGLALTQAQLDAIADQVPGGASNIQDLCPLGPLQQGMLFHHLRQHTGDPFAAPVVLALPAKQQVERLVNDLSRLVQRHDILRTSFVWRSLVQPVQVVWREAPLSTQWLDVPADQTALSFLSAQLDGRQHRLRLDRAPVLQALIAQDTDHGRWLLGLSLHHLLLDHRSVGLLMQELALLQAAEEAVLPVLRKPQPLREVAWRLGQQQSAEAMAAQEAFFRAELADLVSPTTPFGLEDLAAEDQTLQEHRLDLPAALVSAVRLRARNLDVSLSALLHLAWALVLARCSAREDVVFGTVLLGRNQHGLAHAMGMLINTLPLRVRLSDKSLGDAAHAVQQSLAGLLRHDQASLVLAQRCSGVAAPAPLFTALFNHRQHGAASEAGSGLLPGAELLWAQERTGYPLALAVDDDGKGLSLAVQAAAPADAELLARLMRNALEGLSNAPTGSACMGLDLLDEAGRQALLDMNPGPLEVPAQTLHARFAEQARAQPDAVAVLDGEQVLSYAQLAEQARTLAEQIRRALPTPQHPDLAAAPIVAVALPRSAATVVAFLATLQAGAVYLPLDCSYPTARLQMLLDDAHAALLIDAAPTLGLRCVRLPSAVVSALTSLHLPSAAGPCAPPPAPAVCPGDLAYLIYTSGSTGLPKPVAVSHAAALNLAFARRSHAPVGPGDRILAGVSVGFDVSIEQLLLPLLHGAAVVIAPALGQIDARAFWSLVQGYQVSDINSVPSFIDAVCDALPAAGVPSLKRLMLGGEPFTPALALKLRQRLPGVALWNIYGPTEVCIEATAWRVPDEGPLPAALPIGQPLANYRAYVLDSLGRLCPPGVAGELGLAGAGLARGYLGRPGETARRFVADPFGAPGTRLYRTGDRARWRLDGQLEFLGRDDEQVKIRGFRIETGEVQSALLMHPAVRQAAVVPWSLHGQATRLVAYVVMQPAAAGAPHSSPSDTLADAPLLRAWLAERLPHHMLPQDFIVLASLPITTNGKLDRRALPAPVELTTTASYAPPQGELEQTLASVWQTVLGVPRVGRHDSFFDLGGHSLLAIAMVEQLRHAGWSLDLASVFASPALDALAAACTPLLAEGDDTTGAPSPIPQGVDRLSPQMLPAGLALTQAQLDAIADQVPGGASNIQDLCPLGPLQQGMLFHHLRQVRGDVFLTPFVLAFDSESAMLRAVAGLRAVVARHDILRTAVVWEGLEVGLQVVLRQAELPLAVLPPTTYAQLPSALQRMQAALAPDSQRMNLAHAPLLRLTGLADPSNDRWLLGVLLHHLVLDHHSMRTVMHEAALQAAEEAVLPVLRKPQPLREVAWRLGQQQSAEAMAAQEAFFRAELADLVSPTTPFGLEDLAAEDQTLQEHRLDLPAALVSAVRLRARNLDVSLSALLHLAWALVLARCSAREDVVFGTVLLGRNQHGLAHAMGMLINTLPLRVRLSDKSLGDAAHAVQQSLAGLLRHDQASLVLAQRCSGVAAPAPLFTALFNHRQHGAASEAGSGLLPGAELLWAQERTGYPLALAVDDDGKGLSLAVQAAAPADAELLARLMRNALEGLSNAPTGSACMGLDLLDEAGRQALLDMNPGPLEVPAQTLHARFAEQARAQPDAVAVLDGEQVLSYAQLAEQARTLAEQIRRALPTPQHPDLAAAPIVAVALPRSAATVVAFLATLQAGAVYLPLDCSYPTARLQMLLDDAHAALLIDAAPTLGLRCARLPSAVVSALTSLHLPSAAGPCAPPPAPAVCPGDLAYLIYTSGSTGLPKPVAVSHAAALNLAFARRSHAPVGPGDRILAGVSVGFDVSIEQLLLPLLHGAAVVIAPALGQIDARAFWSLVQGYQVSDINSVPSFIDAVCDALPAAGVPSLKRLMLGGEPFTPALALKLRQRLPGVALWNIYGPTEVCIEATAWRVPDEGPLPAALPIGQPLANYRAYVLDSLGRLCPPGVAGELGLAGAGLARGYLGRPGETARRFVADPFGAPGTRLYRTGDRARWRLDGQLEFLGRDDEQVKIRGFRIETGEVQSALLMHPAVRQAAVVPWSLHGQATRLVAYVVMQPAAAGAPHSSPSDTLADAPLLRAWLAERLPHHMLPQDFIVLASLPITTNGKLDRRALPAPVELTTTASYAPPQGELEQTLASVWQTVLGVPRVGRHDSFFDLGGHSLLAIRLVQACTQAARVFGITDAEERLTLANLLTAPTLAGMADGLQTPDSLDPPSCTSLLVPLRATGKLRPLFCVHPQSGWAWCFAPLAQALPAEQPVWALQARGLMPGEKPHDSMADMVKDYLQAMRSVQPVGPYRLLGYSSGGIAAQEMARQLVNGGEQVELLTLLDSPLPGSIDAQALDEQALLQAAGMHFGFGTAGPKGTPLLSLNSTGDLARGLRNLELVGQDFTAAGITRMIDTARAIANLSRTHVARHCNTSLLQVRALRRSSALDDWSTLAPEGDAETHDLDVDHAQLVTVVWAQVLAALLKPHLVPTTQT